MYDGDKAVITMVQQYKEGLELDDTIYTCTVVEYQKDSETIHLLLGNGEIEDISLDALYECRIQTISVEAVCTGKITERYLNRAGMILVFNIVNGIFEVQK